MSLPKPKPSIILHTGAELSNATIYGNTFVRGTSVNIRNSHFVARKKTNKIPAVVAGVLTLVSLGSWIGYLVA